MISPLPRLEDGSAVLWATLALGKLGQLISKPAMDDADLETIPLRITFDKVLATFNRMWTHQPPQEINSLMTEFQTNAAAYNAISDFQPLEADTINYCVGIFSAFHLVAIKRMNNPRLLRRLFHPAIITQLVEKLDADVFEPALESFLRNYGKVEQLPDEERTASITKLNENYAMRVQTQMMNFIRFYDEWREDPPILLHDRCHGESAGMIEGTFYDYVEGELWELYAEFQRFEDLSMLERRKLIKSSIRIIAMFFAYTDELLFPPEISSSGSSVSDLDSESSEGWEEYEVNDLVPVLTGPETATMADISSTVPPDTVTDDCSICIANGDDMRQLNVYGHMFCENCLTAQLNAQGNYRYRCAICRANMFP